MTTDVQDFDFDSVPDAPDYRPFPTGAHRVRIVSKVVDVEAKGEKPANRYIAVSATYIEPVECDTDNLPKAGDISQQRYYTFSGKDGGEFARSQLKRIAAPVCAAIGQSGLQAFLAATAEEGLVGVLVVKEEPNEYQGKVTMQNKFLSFTLD